MKKNKRLRKEIEVMFDGLSAKPMGANKRDVYGYRGDIKLKETYVKDGHY